MIKSFLFAVLICLFVSPSRGAAPASVVPERIMEHPVTSVRPALSVSDIAHWKIRDIQKMMGRKLTLKEKLSIKLYQWTLKHKPRRKEEKNPRTGNTAMILGIIAAALFLVPYANIVSLPLAILALVLGYKARRADPEDRDARTAIILGWVVIGAFVILLAIAIAIVAAWGGFFG